MGGHGGLNILPQKRWNVYNRDNIEKVERDKRKAEERRKEQEEKQREVENESRLRVLRKDKKKPPPQTSSVSK